MKIKKIDDYFMLNESFKSKTIATLVNTDEIDNNGDLNALLNQITEDDILGIVDTAEEANALMQDYDNSYIDNAYTNYRDFTIRLKNDKFLVLRIKKSELKYKLDAIRNIRAQNKFVETPKNRKKFLDRKKIVEEDKAKKENIKEYWNFIEFLKANNIEKAFFKKANEEGKKCALSVLKDNDFEADAIDILLDGDDYETYAETKIKIGDYWFNIWFFMIFNGYVQEWYQPKTYWEPEEYSAEIKEGNLYLDYADICVYDNNDNLIYDFRYEYNMDESHIIDINEPY